MNKFSLTALLFFLIVSSNIIAQEVTFEWVRTLASTDSQGTFGVSTVTNIDGSITAVGSFHGTVDFDSGPNVVSLTATSNPTPEYSVDNFIVKYDADGNLIWVKQFGGQTYDAIHRIKTDENGNIFITGGIFSVFDLDPGPNVFNTEYHGSDDNMFVLKLNSNGDFVWGKQIPSSTFFLFQTELNIDGDGNVYLGGAFRGTQDFDPGSGVFQATAKVVSYEDAFILKLDPFGNFVWMKQIENTSQSDVFLNGIKTDLQGNVYVSGSFTQSMDFDPGINQVKLTSSGPFSGYLLKLDKNGNFTWVKQFGTGGSAGLGDLEIDKEGSIYAVGAFSGTVDFDPNQGTSFLTGGQYSNCFVLKLSSSGNLIYARSFVGEYVNGRSIVLDNNKNVYICGRFSGEVDFDPGIGVYTLQRGNCYAVKLDENGNFTWAAGFLMTDDGYYGDEASDLALDSFENVYVTGGFSSTMDFDPNASVHLENGDSQGKFFLVKLSQCKASTNVINVATCGSYMLNGTAYNSPGTYYQRINNAVGCDSVIQLNLTSTKVTEQVKVTTCDSYTWRGKLLTASGIYTDTLLTSEGCDSIVEMDLTLTKDFSSIKENSCGVYNWNGREIKESGVYYDTLKNVSGCDSVVELTLEITKKSSQSFINTCKPYLWNNKLLSISGVYYDTLRTTSNCDSIVQLTFELNEIKVKETKTSCEPYFWNNTLLSTTGTYRDTLLTANQCDSIIEIQFTLLEQPKPYLGKDTVICGRVPLTLNPGNFSSYLWSNNTSSKTLELREPGIYWVKVINTFGCFAADTITLSKSGSEACNLDDTLPTPVSVIDFPNAFTPNQDGRNDHFKPRLNVPVKDYKLVIYNKWGQVVFQNHNPESGWDGKIKQISQATDTFVFLCSFTYNNKAYFKKGTFVLIR